MSEISVSIPSAWLDNAAHDLVVVNTLKAAGIPADFIRNDIVHLTEPGTITRAARGKETVFTFTPPTPPPDPKDAIIAALNGKVEAATALITDLQKRAATAENLTSSLEAQVSASTAQIDELKGKIATAESSLVAAQASAPTENIPAAPSGEDTK
jgi:peptidoglycan hydrolase CwlO-like protein